MTWISVKDRLPEKTGTVFVFGPFADPAKHQITTAWYRPETGEWSHLPPPWIASITHWMPWPDPPGEEKPWPRPECHACSLFKSYCALGDSTEATPQLDDAGTCEAANQNAVKPAEDKDEPAPSPAARNWALQIEIFRELSGCPRDTPLENWLGTLHDSVHAANEMRGELNLLREFVQAVADGEVSCFAEDNAYTSLKDWQKELDDYYTTVAKKVLARKAEEPRKTESQPDGTVMRTRCDRCRFWHAEEEDSEIGTCEHYESERHVGEWCSQFQPIEPEKQENAKPT